jgi:predicted Zn-dependent peptidase
MIISVVGGISDPKEKIERAFSKIKPGPIKELTTEEPQQTTIQKTIEKKKILNSYMVLGYKTPIRLHKDSYTLDIIKALLARGQSGKIVEEIRSKRGLAYEVNVYHDPNKDFGTFAVYLNTDKKNIKKAIGIILNEFDKLKNITTEELDDAKGFLEGSYILEKEDTRHTADELNFWEMIKDSSLNQAYLSKIKSITKKDIKETAKRYLTKNYTLAVIEQTN